MDYEDRWRAMSEADRVATAQGHLFAEGWDDAGKMIGDMWGELVRLRAACDEIAEDVDEAEMRATARKARS